MRIALAVLRRDRRSQVATVLVALGVMIGVSLVLWLLAAPNALQARSERAGWRAPQINGSGTSGAVQMYAGRDVFEDRLIERYDVGRLEQGAIPVAKGFPKFPEAGEVLMSPALADLVHTTPAEKLGNRFPGKLVGELGPEALTHPGELVAVVGLAEVPKGWHATDLVGPAATYVDDGKGILFLLTRVGLVVLAVPCLVLVASAARLTAAKRERRLAALRLAGATPRQVVGMTVAETAVGAVIGSLLGVLLVRPFSHLTAQIPWSGGTWFPGDFVPDTGLVVTVAVLAPLLVVGAAVLGLRRVVNRPLATDGVRKVRPYRLLLIVGAIGLFFAGVGYAREVGGRNTMELVALGVGGVALALVLVGPVVTAATGRYFVGRWRRPPTLLAGRRMTSDPVAAFRGSAGVVIAVFTGSMALTMLPGLESQMPYEDGTWRKDALVAQDVSGDATNIRLSTSAPIVPMVVGSFLRDGQSGNTVVVGKCADVALVLENLKCAPGPALYGPQFLDISEFRSNGSGANSGSSADLPKVKLPAQYERRTFEPSGWVSAVIDPELLPSVAGQINAVAVPTTPENRDVVHTALVGALPGAELLDVRQRDLWNDTLVEDLQRATIIGLSIAAVLGGIGAAVAAAGSVIDRRRAFAALIAAGTPIRVLGRALRREMMLPVFAVTLVACGAGLAVGLGLLQISRDLTGQGEFPLTPWVLAPVAVGLVVALVAASACGPVLRGINPREYASE